MSLWIARLPGEWRIAYESGLALVDAASTEVAAVAQATATDHPSAKRFAARDELTSVELAPRTADRPVVSRPDAPFLVPAGEAVVLYVSTPLWVSIHSGPSDQALIDFPILRPSDIWFGPPTAHGELCYAGRTYCRLRLDEVPPLPHRALTAVRIRNRAKDALALERLKLPVESLGLFVDDEERIWTHDVNLERDADGDFAAVRIDDQPPSHARRTTLIATARTPPTPNVVSRVFGSLFGDSR